jgi:hypothetical protein
MIDREPEAVMRALRGQVHVRRRLIVPVLMCEAATVGLIR